MCAQVLLNKFLKDWRKTLAEPLDLRGHKYHSLTPFERIDLGSDKICKWRCYCDCGEIVNVSLGNLRNNHTKSCGCMAKESAILRESYHGLSNTRCYKSWCKIKERCYNPNNPDYYNYGAEGITLCEEWRISFKEFYDYLGESPGKGYSVDRIDNKLGYQPGNVRWSDSKQQARNKTKNRNNTTGHTGVRLDNKAVSGKPDSWYYVAFWRELDGKTRSKAYSFSKHGEKDALQKAIDKRQQMIVKMNKEGAGYSPRHGL